MKTIRHTLVIAVCLMANTAFSQNYIPFYPADWAFKNEADLVDFSQVKSVTAKHLTLDGNEEKLAYQTYLAWNNTYQLTEYQFMDYNNSNAGVNITINYANPHGNALKSVEIINPKTIKPLEEREYTNGSFDVEKISVKRHLPNESNSNIFEVKYEGNDDDYTQETVYTSEKTIKQQTKRWYKRKDNGSYQLIKKRYLGKEFTPHQTDSTVLNENQKKLAHYIINPGKVTQTIYKYRTRKVEIAGNEYDYQQLERIVQNGKDSERYEYEYDSKGNWIIRNTYKMKNARWEFADITRREIEYRN
ncbi:MAG: hypothetical protein KIT66_02665 [Chitinophagaceae bacterium]|nr:hypothetical protein [Chitinophagaceae bacterium]